MNPSFRKLPRMAAPPPTRTLLLLALGATLLATCSGASATLPAVPIPPAPGSISGAEAVNVGSASDTTATARRSDGSTEVAGSTADWQSSSPRVATDSPQRRVTAVLPGSSVISAAFGGQTGQPSVEVMALVPSPNVQLVTVDAGRVVVDGACDTEGTLESIHDAELSFRFEVEHSGTGPTLVWSTSREPLRLGSPSIDNRGVTFARHVSQGEDSVLWFTTTEHDGLLGRNARLSGLAGGRPHTYESGEWAANTSPISVGSSDCGAIVHWSGAVAPTVKTIDPASISEVGWPMGSTGLPSLGNGKHARIR